MLLPQPPEAYHSCCPEGDQPQDDSAELVFEKIPVEGLPEEEGNNAVM